MRRIYVGIRADGERHSFLSWNRPTQATHGDVYAAVIGPFGTWAGADVMRINGAGNPHIQTVADAERLAREGKGRAK